MICLALPWAVAACGLDEVGPDLDKWRAEHSDAAGKDASPQDASQSDATSADTLVDTAAGDAAVAADVPDAASDTQGGCNVPGDCPAPGECLVATCEAHVCGTKALVCEPDGNPCDQELCQAGKCGHSPVDGAACDDGSACTGPDLCKGGVCGGASLLGSKILGDEPFYGVVQTAPDHTLAWSAAGLIDLDGVWPPFVMPKDTWIDTVAAVSDQDVLVFGRGPAAMPKPLVMRVGLATGENIKLPSEVLPPATGWCSGAHSLPDHRVVALCGGYGVNGAEFMSAVVLGTGGQARRWIPVSNAWYWDTAASLVGGEVWYALNGPLTATEPAQLVRVSLASGKATTVGLNPQQLSYIKTFSARPGGPVLALGRRLVDGNGVGTAALLDLNATIVAQPANKGLQDYQVRAALWHGGTWLTEGAPQKGDGQRRHEVLGPNLESLQSVIHAPDEEVFAMAPDGKGNFWLVGGTINEPKHGKVWHMAATGEETCANVDCVKKPGSCTATACAVAWCSTAGCQSAPLAGPLCDDGAPCTFGETCIKGACAGGSGMGCDDTSPCTLDSCDPQAGCIHSAAPADTACDDGDMCWTGDTCNATGSCLPGKQALGCPAPALCQSAVCTPFVGCGVVDKSPGAACNGEVGMCADQSCWTPFAVSIAAGPSHSCALRPDHSLWCWGSNADGQLLATGLPSTPTATQVGAGSYTQVAVGEGFTCALDTAKNLWCWGRNDHGQTGAALGKTSAPAQVALPIEVTQIAAGTAHMCAGGLDKAGIARIYCWGAAGKGQLGQGSGAVDSPMPQEVPGMSGVTWLASGENTSCAVVAGKVYCWGAAGTAWINGKATPKPGAPNPVDVAGGFDRIWVSDGLGCGRALATGIPNCWGAWSSPLLLGFDGVGIAVLEVSAGAVRTMSVGSDHRCHFVDGGKVLCKTTAAAATSWGKPNGIYEITPLGSAPIVDLSSGGSTVCARMADGSVRCGGSGSSSIEAVLGTEAKAYKP